MINIGIQPGLITGFAAYNPKAKYFLEVQSFKILSAIKKVEIYINEFGKDNINIFIADHRTLKNTLNPYTEKRDSIIWHEFVTDNRLNHKFVNPSDNSLTAIQFKLLTGCKMDTNRYSRAAAMMIFNKQ